TEGMLNSGFNTLQFGVFKISRCSYLKNSQRIITVLGDRSSATGNFIHAIKHIDIAYAQTVCFQLSSCLFRTLTLKRITQTKHFHSDKLVDNKVTYLLMK